MYGEDSLLQVVGHTPVEKIYRSSNVISCDVFSTYPDGRPIGTQEYPVIDTVESSLRTLASNLRNEGKSEAARAVERLL